MLPACRSVEPVLEPRAREVADVVALLAEERLQVLEAAAGGNEIVQRRARAHDAAVHLDRLGRQVRDRAGRLGVDVVDVPVVRDAVHLLHHERARRGADVRHEVHRVDLDVDLALDGRMLVVRAPEADVLGLEGEVELLEDLVVAEVERLLHRGGRLPDDLVQDGLFAERRRVDVGPQDLDDAVHARHRAVLGLDVAEERLADRRRAEHLLDLDGEDFAVRAVDELQELGLDGLRRNRREAGLHVLQGELRLGVEGADRQALEHLLEERPRALQELGHLLRVCAAHLRVADERGEHRALVHLRRAREVVAEHVQRELALARGLVDALLAVELGERLLPVALGVTRPVRLKERRHLGLHGRDELRGGAVDLRLDRGERVARAFGKLVGVHELRDVELLDFRKDVLHCPAHVRGNVLRGEEVDDGGLERAGLLRAGALAREDGLEGLDKLAEELGAD